MDELAGQLPELAVMREVMGMSQAPAHSRRWDLPICGHGYRAGYCTEQTCPHWWQDGNPPQALVLPATRVEIPAEVRRVEWHRHERCWEIVLIVQDEVAEDMGRFVGLRVDGQITLVAEARTEGKRDAPLVE